MQLPQVDVMHQAGGAAQTGLRDEVRSEIQAFQGLASMEILDLCDVVQGQAQMAQLLWISMASRKGCTPPVSAVYTLPTVTFSLCRFSILQMRLP